MRGCPDCPRGYTTCLPLDNVIADDEETKSFICVGLNNGIGRQVEDDYMTLCVRAGQEDDATWIINEETMVDRLDLGDQASVISTALVMDERLGQMIGSEPIDKFDKYKELIDAEEAEVRKDVSR